VNAAPGQGGGFQRLYAEGGGGWFRQLTPLVLLAILAGALLEPWLPGIGWLRQQFGDTVLLRVAIAGLAFYTLLLWGEALRLHSILTAVLGAVREFDQSRQGSSAAARNPKARLEAARLLIAALGSEDPEIRITSRHNLARLAGKDLGDDPTAWTQWLQAQERSGDNG
jgi:hypothetical protein